MGVPSKNWPISGFDVVHTELFPGTQMSLNMDDENVPLPTVQYINGVQE